jgi:hypothetical protein
MDQPMVSNMVPSYLRPTCLAHASPKPSHIQSRCSSRQFVRGHSLLVLEIPARHLFIINLWTRPLDLQETHFTVHRNFIVTYVRVTVHENPHACVNRLSSDDSTLADVTVTGGGAVVCQQKLLCSKRQSSSTSQTTMFGKKTSQTVRCSCYRKPGAGGFA